MIGLDTNILARYYVEDAGDTEAQRQRALALKLIESGQPLMVSPVCVWGVWRSTRNLKQKGWANFYWLTP